MGACADHADGGHGADGTEDAEHGYGDSEEVLVWGWRCGLGELLGCGERGVRWDGGIECKGRFWRTVEEGCGSCDEDDTDETDKGGELLLAGEGLTGDEEGANIAGQDRGEEGKDGGFGERKVEKRKV